MRPWRLRLTLRRSRIQWALLCVVLLVSILSSTLLATLYLLSNATENFAARSALSDAPAQDVRLVQRIVPTGELDPVLDAATTSAAEVFGDIPVSTQIHVEGDLIGIHREEANIALGYFSVMDGIDEVATLRDGRWADQTSPGETEATVPFQLARDLELEVGDTFEVSRVYQRDDTLTVTIVGTYTAIEPDTDFWRYDRFIGEGFKDQWPLPGSGGLVLTEGYGPLISSTDMLDEFGLSDVAVTTVPDFSQVSLAQVSSVIERLEEVETAATRTVAADGRNIRIATAAPTSLGGVIGSLAVTRSSVLVTGLLLLVLSVAALGQTARLMAERRQSELELMVARGGSGRQVFRLALVEALVLGAITASAGALLARYAYRALASQDAMERAGMNLDPGLPIWTWAVTAVVGLALVVVLVTPLLKRGGSFVDAQQTRSRPGKRAAFQRSGLDVALVVLAALAYWQLRNYESPVLAGGGVARLDPLLAAGPALALLAGALVAVRLIPAASKALEGLASRGRRAVMPLAAWEVGRRPARAVSAILLLTLAVSVGTFAMSYLTTWRLSQDHQAQYRHPADLVVSELSAPALAQASVLNASGIDATSSRLLHDNVIISTDVDSNVVLIDGLDGRDVRMVAIDNAGLEFYSEGRLGEEGGSAIPAALTSDRTLPEAAFALPEGAAGLGMDVTITTTDTALNNITASLRAVMQDGSGQLFTVDMGTVPVDGETHTVQELFANIAWLDSLSGPMSMVGLQSVWFADDPDAETSDLQSEGPLTMTLSVDEISALELGVAVPVAGEDPQYLETKLDADDAQAWYAKNAGVGITSLAPDDDQIHAEVFTVANNLRFRPVVLTQSAESVVGPVPLVVTANVAANLRADIGDPVRIQVGNAIVDATIDDIIPLFPDQNPREEAILANIDHLSIAIVQAGGPAIEADRWAIDIEDEDIAAYRAQLPDDAVATGRNELATSLMEDPLRVATQAALWLVTGAAVVLAAVGFAVHAVVTVRSRHVEFAQLRAVGVGRGQLLRVVSGETMLLSLLGVLFGVTLGVALGYLVGPLVAVGADGRPPLPAVLVDIPWETVGLLALEVAAVLALTVILVGIMLRRINPAQLLRMGD